MRKLVFATNNDHKLKEITQLMPMYFELLSLKDIGCSEDIPETGPTLEVNAAQKSFYIWEKYRMNCFADDTGLEIEALANEPGVYSARYAGEEKSASANMDMVLEKMAGITNRRARFRCVISLILEGMEIQFEGVVLGEILPQRAGEAGFGYDPIFRPEGYSKSFAQMSEIEKNSVSHRGRAAEKLIEYLTKLH